MKIGLITDTHYNFRKANKPFHEYFAKFYDEIFFPTLKKNKIKTVIHLGDAFDSRKGVDYWALDWAKENVYDKFQDLGITVYNIVGNHDAYYKNSNEINSIDTLLQQYYNVVRVSKPTEYTIEGMEAVLLPWICTDNEKETFELLDKTEAKVVFGHLELNGFSVYPGQYQQEGLDKKVFQKFDRVYSGHYHTRSDDGKIFYLGNPYQMFWNDLNDKRGFHIFDTDDYKLDYYQNPHTMFERVYYENNNPKDFDASYLTDKMVKIVVRQRDDYKMFDKFVDAIVKVNPLELKIIENVDVYDEDVNCDEIPTEDTMSILDKYVEESEFELDKNTIKKLLREFYKEALEVE
jgi:DNA repair exonuclease SbcCD nuclease subunit